MKIAFFSSEVVPFAKTGGMADVCGALPTALEKLGHKVIIVMPLYRCVDARQFNIKRLNNRVLTATMGNDIDVFFIDREEMFDRSGLYGNKHGDYPDNLDRFQYFCWEALMLLKQLHLRVDIVHCHDWQTGLVPVYLKFNLAKDTFYQGIKTVLSIHNLAFQGLFHKDMFPKLNLDQKLFGPEGLEFYDQISLLKGGILYSDRISTVSPTYAEEIQLQEYGCGMEGVLLSRKENVKGILNGLDYAIWNPETDSLIVRNYGAANPEGKAENKSVIQKEFHLSAGNKPLFGFVGRLSHQKGIELIAEAAEELSALDLHMVFLGIGETKYHNMLERLAVRFSETISICLKFNEELAHRIYAGSDFFLMPSSYEPCGLSQMISLSYGTVPVVYKTGGLADTITPFEISGNGIVFDRHDKTAFVDAVKRAVELYKKPQRFKSLVKKTFKYRFRWEDSAKEYEKLYEDALSES